MSRSRQLAKSAFAITDFVLPSPSGPRILIYHRIGIYRGLQMELATEDFEWQLDWLIANREIVSLDEALRRWGDAGSDRLVVLTFDDGYADTYTVAYPFLTDRKIPFTLYVATSHIESGVPLSAGNDAEPLTWDRINEMAASGLMTIGAHTHRHPDLRRLVGDEVEADLSLADSIIEQRSGRKPLHFAYPWGYWSKSASPIVRRRYRSSVLGAPWRSKSASGSHDLHRYPVQLSDGKRYFEARVRGGLLLEERARRILRRYSGP